MSHVKTRPADVADIPQLVELLGIATYGFIEHVYRALSEPGINIQHALKARMVDAESALSLHKAKVAEINGQIAGFIMCEELPDPVDLLSEDTHSLLRPLFELESMAPGTTLVNFVAAYPHMRGLGVGSTLLGQAETTSGTNGMSLTIHDLNVGAKKLYERRGYREVARRPIVKQGWQNPATEWVLMIKL